MTDPRNYLVFEASFPKAGGWIGDEPDQTRPPGRELIEFLSSVLQPAAPLDELWNEEGYGWAFNTSSLGITVYVLVQRLEHWLVIVQEVSFKPRFMRGLRYREAVERVCSAIIAAFRNDPRFGEVLRFTAAEYAANAPGLPMAPARGAP